MTRGPSRKLAVILHADVVGSTTLVQRDEALAHTRIQEAFRRFSSTIEAFDGVAHELRGDALVAEFARASDAVSAGLAFQIENIESNALLGDDLQPQLRIGISLGEVVIADGSVTGAGVVLAQRVEQLADPDGVCITGAVHEAVPLHLPVDYSDLGKRRMKGFEERVQAYGASVKAGEKIPPPEPTISAETHSRMPRFLWTSVAIVSLTLVAGSLAWWQPWKRESEAVSVDRMAFPLPDKPSIAVLPFDNMSGDPEQEYFVDGMTEDLITDLSKVSGLFVIARHSTFAYKETSPDVRQVANELGVRYVLEGSMRRSGNSIRINAQLIDATTGGHIWAERYDGTLDDVFALQDRVTEKIVSALAVNLTAAEQSVRATEETDNSVAYDAYLQGMEFYRRFTPYDFAKAISHFQRATRLDPDYGRAYAALASVYWESVRQGDSWIREFAENLDDYESSMAVARSRSDNYLRLAKKNPSPLYYYLLSAKRWDYRQFADAIADAERGIALDPNDPDGYVALAWALIFDGRPREALAAVDRAMRLDPQRPQAYKLVLGMIQFGLGHYESAATALQEAHEGNLRNRILNVPLAAAYANSGRLDDTRDALKRYTDAESSSTTNVGLLMSWWPFKREADIRRFGGSLVEGGLCCEKYLEGYIERARRGGTLQ